MVGTSGGNRTLDHISGEHLLLVGEKNSNVGKFFTMFSKTKIKQYGIYLTKYWSKSKPKFYMPIYFDDYLSFSFLFNKFIIWYNYLDFFKILILHFSKVFELFKYL